jgi:hypothetical protein
MMRAQVAELNSIPRRLSAVCMRHFPKSGFSWSLRISFLTARVALHGPFLAFLRPTIDNLKYQRMV